MFNLSMVKEIGFLTWFVRRIAWRVISRCASARIPFVLPGNHRILLPPRSPFAADIYCTRGFVDWGSEQLVLDYLAQLPERGCSYDVGANMGYYSLLLASVTDPVFAFEPDPRNLEDLRAQSILNLTLVQKAVSETSGTARFDVSSGSTISHLATGTRTSVEIEVECTTLDAFRSSRPAEERVSFVKMDVEGYEILCLRGASKLTLNERPLFLIEFGVEEGRPNCLTALGEFVAAHVYELFAMIRRPKGPFRFHTTLESVSADQLASLEYKMLFLAPQEDSFFKQRVAAGFHFEDLIRTAK
jgi:FkbM family methyltransferase